MGRQLFTQGYSRLLFLKSMNKQRFRRFDLYTTAYRTFYKLLVPPALKHMAITRPFLRLMADADAWHIYWKGHCIGRTGSWADLSAQAPVRLFSVGSGPSINQQDLDLLPGEQCVLVNGAISLVLDGTVSRPFAVMIEDSRFIYERADMLMQLPQGTRLCLVASAMQALGVTCGAEGLAHFELFLIDGFETPYGKARRTVNEAPSESYRMSAKAKLSLDLAQGHFGCGTVMYCGIQLAFHLRVQQLYLVGFDLTDFDQPRFYENQHNAAWTGLQNAYQERILPALRLAVVTAQEFNMSIENCSHTSIIPRELIPFNAKLMPPSWDGHYAGEEGSAER